MRAKRRWCLHQRAGFTLLEVVVVLGVLGLLTAILLPAVQQARESSRNVTCKNRLRQLGLAMGNVVDADGAYPTASFPVSAYWRMLPYLDRAAEYEYLTAGHYTEPLHMADFTCPDDPEVVLEGGEASYFFSYGTQFRLYPPTNGFRNGTHRDTRPADVSDGLSQTAAMSERLNDHRINNWASVEQFIAHMERQPRRYFWFTETRFGDRGEEGQAVQQCREHRTTPYPQWASVHLNMLRGTVGYDHLLPPNHPACYNGPEDLQMDHDLSLIPASSLHPGGVNTLMGDGSVHFVSQSIDAGVWKSIGTINGNESVALPF